MHPNIIDAEVRLLPEFAARLDYLANDSDPIEKKIFQHADIESGFPNWGLASLLKSMEFSGINKAVVTGLPFKNSIKHHASVAYLRECVSKHPETFRALYSPRFEDVDEDIAQLEMLLHDGFSGIEIIPAWQGTNFLDKCYAPLFKLIRQKNLVVKIYVSHVYSDDKLSSGHHLINFRSTYPDVMLVTPHLGGMLFWYQLHPPLAEALSNIGYISSIPSTPKLVAMALLINPNSLMFGTDFPFNWGFNQAASIQALEESGVSVERNSNFFSTNASFWFGF